MKASLWVLTILMSLVSQAILAQSTAPGRNISQSHTAHTWRPMERSPQVSKYGPSFTQGNTRQPTHLATSEPPVQNNRSMSDSFSNGLNSMPTPWQQSPGGYIPNSQETYYPDIGQQGYWPNPDSYNYPAYDSYYGNDGYYSGYYRNDGYFGDDARYDYYQSYGAPDYAPSPYDTYGQDYYAPATPYNNQDYRYPAPSEYRPNNNAVESHWPASPSQLNTLPHPAILNSQTNLPLVNGLPARFRPWQAPEPGVNQPNTE